MNVPQITLDTTSYLTNIVFESEQPVPDEFIAQTMLFNIEDGPIERTFKLYPDGTYVSVSPQSIILEFNEINSQDIGDNFEIELFEVTSSALKNKESYVPLYFVNGKFERNNDNLIVDVGNKKEIFSADDTSLTEYYLTVNVDTEISSDKLQTTSSVSPNVFQQIKK